MHKSININHCQKAVSNSTDYIYNYTIKIAPPSNDAKCYYMKHSIVSPSFLSFNFLAATVFDYKFATNTNAFIIDNSLFLSYVKKIYLNAILLDK